MPRKVDPEVLAGFIEEARGYLPRILQGINAFRAHPGRGETLEEAHRHAHTIKGAASMVGLNGLSAMANNLEEALDELMRSDRLPAADEAADLLRHIVAQLELYLDGKSNGGVREKPLLEEAGRAYQQLRSLPTEDRAHYADHADEPEPRGEADSSADQATDPIATSLDGLRGRLKEAAAGEPGDLAAMRQPFEALQAEALDRRLPALAEALQRLGLMAEVWECLAAEGPQSVDEVAEFCDQALDRLAQVDPEADGQDDASWILEESDKRWGEYLTLLDASPDPALGLDEAGTDGETEAGADEGPAEFDAGALLRLLGGQVGEAGATVPVDPAASEPAAAADDLQADDGAPTELREIFALEAEDHLRLLSSLLPTLERQPDNKPLVQDIRRSAHTLKGSAAMVGVRDITQLSHRMEDLLDLIYEGSRVVTPEVVRLLLASTDALEDMVGHKSDEAAVRDLYARFDALLGPVADEKLEAAAGLVQAETAAPEPRRAPASRTLTPQAAESETPTDPRKQSQFVRFPIERLDELVKLLGELVITRTFLEQRMADLTRQVGELEHSTDRLKSISSKLEIQYEASSLLSESRSPLPGAPRYTNGNGHPLSVTSQTHGFDDLEFDRYTEFHLLTRSLSETASDIQTVSGELGGLIGDFDSYLNRQARLSSEVEDKLMRSRMVPLATLASRLHRTVRNVASQQGKLVDLLIEGEATELDKTVLEEMADPLLHLLRNSVDHGIESPAVREAIGKAPRGQIRLRADYVGNQVVIQIGDDGAGLDPEDLRKTAVERGFLSAAEVAKLTDAEAFALVYQPGFSTTQQISEVSGRGVGLDIVRANVHRLKGTLSLESQAGKGVTFTIRLPMTLAVMRAILVKAHQETFAIPLGAVKQILRLDSAEMETVGKEPVVRVGDQIYPVFSLGKVLNLRQPADESATRRPLLILDVGSKQVAILVDQLLGGREIVLKNLGSHLRRVPNLMGATLMGDGSVVLILDPVELVRDAVQDRAPARAPQTSALAKGRDTWSVLIVDDSPSVRRVVSTLIRNAGWRPITAKDGLEALELLHHSASMPDLILLDVEIPRMDGYELLATLKAQEAYAGIPVVMVTSRAGDKHRRKAIDLGSSAYVVKPYQDEALLNVIRHLVRESRSGQVVHA